MNYHSHICIYIYIYPQPTPSHSCLAKPSRTPVPRCCPFPLPIFHSVPTLGRQEPKGQVEGAPHAPSPVPTAGTAPARSRHHQMTCSIWSRSSNLPSPSSCRALPSTETGDIRVS
ncbi:hypothetical protein BC938DRAFT_473513 [Jimgerdemannia flammicorona]|uniref:Uncharacterized protein n=1 Tax=Jimgerdemannia flammicorona TaxID=994334 RepID=A0A433Q3T7_9FUNG|nr:hypothetical protein BC938DRAFT_473513 [Jimgerdemannia flammicorona]